MELLLMVVGAIISFYFLYWVVRLGVRDGIADADERRNGGGSENDRRRSIGS